MAHSRCSSNVHRLPLGTLMPLSRESWQGVRPHSALLTSLLESPPALPCLWEKVLTPRQVSQLSFPSSLVLQPTPLQSKTSLSFLSHLPAPPPPVADILVSQHRAPQSTTTQHSFDVFDTHRPAHMWSCITLLHLSFLICKMGRSKASTYPKQYWEDWIG